MNMDVDHNEIVTSLQKNNEAAGAEDVIAAGTSTAAAVGLGAQFLLLQFLVHLLERLEHHRQHWLGLLILQQLTISQIAPAIVLGAVLAEIRKSFNRWTS